MTLDASTFARELAATTSDAGVHQLIVERVARAIGAQQGVLATYEEQKGHLVVGATYGYPAALVEDFPIEPGSGVLGSVFASKETLLVTDIGDSVGGRPSRLRYRSPSFVAIPMIVGDAVLGVLSFADRSDGRPFDEADVVIVEALAPPAALALACERLTKRKRQLEYAVGVDPLTELFNPRYFDARLQEETERARRYKQDLTLLSIDVDDFKSLNDTHGHLAGDAILRGVAQVLRRSVRVFDVCIRCGGDEFAILAPRSGASDAARSAERIRGQVQSYRTIAAPPVPAGLSVTVSIGGAVLAPDASPREFRAAADRALYEAKAGGKNRVYVETPAGSA